jgi:ubiquinone/menaquinone biosynthesis C-methylase UbiE
MSSDRSARGYYDDFSRGYERERGAGYHALIDALEVEAVADLARGKRVLEVGCGTGLIMERLQSHAAQVCGVDLSPGMAHKALERGHHVMVASATELPFADHTFDMVCSFKVLAHVPDIRRALDELVRVTRPGGHLALEFYNPLSVRYLAKRVAGPGRISEGKTEADVYTRWDTPWHVRRMLPPELTLLHFRGVRVFTPAAFAHRIPGLGGVLARMERAAVASPLRGLGGFLIAVARKQDNGQGTAASSAR